MQHLSLVNQQQIMYKLISCAAITLILFWRYYMLFQYSKFLYQMSRNKIFVSWAITVRRVIISGDLFYCIHIVRVCIPIAINCCRSSRPEVLLGKGVLKICSKFTGEHPCQSAISEWVFSCKFATYFEKIFS